LINEKVKNTIELARRVRVHALKMVNKGGSSHIGSALSIADIVSVLYGRVMNYRAKEPKWEDRDRFILSKGHAGVSVYAVLAEMGFFNSTKLSEHYQDGSVFSGHISHVGIPGVELSTGSLGHGLSVGSGMAYAAKLNGKKHRIFVLMGDGELDEGSNWEVFLFAGHHNLSRLVAIIDRNYLQSMKSTEETLSLEPLRDKFVAFGWNVLEVDGHNHRELISSLLDNKSNKPTVVIANTTKGKGVSYMENSVQWHYKTPEGVQLEQAMFELGKKQ
jgi:transketolase